MELVIHLVKIALIVLFAIPILACVITIGVNAWGLFTTLRDDYRRPSRR
jgi:hypothetical protein